MRARLQAVSVRHAIALVAIAFFFAPMALRVAGVTARQFENRPMAAFPKVSQGWDGLQQAKRFFVDRMPLREQAVRADAWISTVVFDTSPSAGRTATRGPAGVQSKPPAPKGPAPPVDTALAGKGGWLFLDGELNRACNPFVPWSVAMERWQRLASIIRASGRRVVLVFPPDKSTIYPEYLPDSFALRDCAGPGHRAAWEAIEGATDPAVLGLRRTMLDAKRSFGTAEPYYRMDTHWNTMGGVIAVREVLQRLGTHVRMRESEIGRGRMDYQGDLSSLSGSPRLDSAPIWTITRDPAAPRLPGRTLFVKDSFGTAMQDQLQLYLESPTLLEWFGTPPAGIIAAIGRSDTVVLETVEREVNIRASSLGLLTPSFLDQLERELPRQRE